MPRKNIARRNTVQPEAVSTVTEPGTVDAEPEATVIEPDPDPEPVGSTDEAVHSDPYAPADGGQAD